MYSRQLFIRSLQQLLMTWTRLGWRMREVPDLTSTAAVQLEIRDLLGLAVVSLWPGLHCPVQLKWWGCLLLTIISSSQMLLSRPAGCCWQNIVNITPAVPAELGPSSLLVAPTIQCDLLGFITFTEKHLWKTISGEIKIEK